MADVIDDLFVRLGLQTDKKQFDEAKGAFNSLRTTALQFGAAIGAGFGMRQMTFGFSQMVEQAVRFGDAFSVAPEFVDQLGFAFKAVGGDASDAFSSIQRVADLIERTEWGEIPEQAFREAGVDPYILEGVESIAEAYERLSEAGQNLDPETARRFFSALGFSQNDLALFRGQGDQSFGALMEDARNLASLSQSMQDQGVEFQQGVARLGRAMDGVSREISNLFVGDMAETMNKLADWLADNRDDIASFSEKAIPILTGMAVGIGTLVAIQGGRAALGALANIPGATALAAGLGAGVYLWSQNREDMGDGFNQRDFDTMMQDLQERRQEIEGSNPIDETRNMLQGLGMGGNTTYELNIDARGSTNPMETERAVERAVERGLNKSVESTLNDLRSAIR